MFFVLSGFLVSGLLFKEKQATGTIKRWRFFARRGFKIYPMFYLSIIITFIILLTTTTLNYKGAIIKLLPEIFFVQNYKFGFWGHHWTLAVEEHFYILLLIFLYFLKRYDLIPRIAVGIFIVCLILRLIQNYLLDYDGNFGQTHLRIDSLFAGVLISYYYNYHFEVLKRFYRKRKKLIIPLIILPFTFTWQTTGVDSFFIKTFGFTLIYIGFSALLITFLFGSAEKIITSVFSSYFYRFISWVGFYSYGIYLFHYYIVKFVVPEKYQGYVEFTLEMVVSFLFYCTLSIALGVIMSKIVEIPMLKVRDRWFPK